MDVHVCFVSFWAKGIFFIGNALYVYKESDLSCEKLYLMKWIITFFKELGYVVGDFPRDEALNKHL